VRPSRSPRFFGLAPWSVISSSSLTLVSKCRSFRHARRPVFPRCRASGLFVGGSRSVLTHSTEVNDAILAHVHSGCLVELGIGCSGRARVLRSSLHRRRMDCVGLELSQIRRNRPSRGVHFVLVQLLVNGIFHHRAVCRAARNLAVCTIGCRSLR